MSWYMHFVAGLFIAETGLLFRFKQYEIFLWTKCYWGKLFSKWFAFLLSVSFLQCSISYSF